MRLRKLLGLALCAIAIGACSLLDPADRTFRGVYVSAFEASSFRVCNASESWWLTDASGTLFSQLPPSQGSAGPFPDHLRVAYIHVKGTRSRRGHHGHLGGYNYEFTVKEVLEVSADTVGKCR